MEQKLNSYELSRAFFNWAFDNPEKIKPIHSAIYFFSIEHCNRLGWKSKFGFPSQMVMEAVGVKNWRTYSKGLNDLVEFGFIEMVESSKNQYSSNIIAIVKNTKAPTKAPTKALDKALQSHGTKQSKSTVSIDKQLTTNNKTTNKGIDILLSKMPQDKRKIFDLWMVYRKEIKKEIKVESTLKTLIERFNLEPIEKIKYTIQKSIENNYVGLFWDNYKGQKVEVADTEQMYWVSSRGNPKVKMTKPAMDKYIKSDGSQLMDVKIIKIK